MEILAQLTPEKQDTPTVWYGCYDNGWQNLIQPEAYSHPAKFSRSLVSRIYSYAMERGWLKPGDTVLDCFGGVGLGALDAGANGLNWVGVELEQRFTDLGQGCDCTGISKADWVRFYGRLEKANYKDGRHWCPECLAQAKQVTDSLQMSFFEPEPSAAYVRGSGIIPETKPHRYKGNLDLFRKYAKPGTFAVLLNGDSRQLRRVIGQAVADGLLSSPPYANGEKGHPSLGSVNKDNWGRDGRNIAGRRGLDGNYGGTNGQLANLKEGDLDGLLSSPPYSESQTGGTDIYNKLEVTHKRKLTDRSRTAGYRADLQGDSPGQLATLPTGDLDSLLSSPPYINSVNQSAGANDTEARIERMRQAGIDVTNRANVGGGNGVARQPQSYGDSSGQLGAMPPGSLADSLVTSPPFAGNTGGRGEASRNGIDAALFDRHSGGMKRGTGDNPGNLDHLPMRGFEESIGGLVTSPPFENQNACNDPKYYTSRTTSGGPLYGDYGQTPGQLGTETGQTFWAAARDIVAESYLALKPGSFSFWVCKKFVRNGCIVDFPNQWQQLCESVGFEYIETIRAMLVSQENEQKDLNGGGRKIQKAKKSFFRRLAERNGSPAIDFEEVVVMRKPEARQ